MLEWTRTFFRDRGYFEVQTPVLSRDVGVDAWLEPFAVPLSSTAAPPGGDGYLQTSPEFAMKRLLAAGAEAIFQIGPAFRQDETGPLHNSEFTMVEWYRAGDSYHDQMELTEQLVDGFLCRAGEETGTPADFPRPLPRITYDDAFRRACGSRVLDRSTAELRRLAEDHDVSPPASLDFNDRDGWLNLLLIELVEPWLKQQPAVFLLDYPASQAALACVRPDDPPVAERFELYLGGLEICNGYQELTDADELRRRIAIHARRRDAEGLRRLPVESRLLQAMESGLPKSSGVALGFDRLLMAALGAKSIADVIAFPFDRA